MLVQKYNILLQILLKLIHTLSRFYCNKNLA